MKINDRDLMIIGPSAKYFSKYFNTLDQDDKQKIKYVLRRFSNRYQVQITNQDRIMLRAMIVNYARWLMTKDAKKDIMGSSEKEILNQIKDKGAIHLFMSLIGWMLTAVGVSHINIPVSLTGFATLMARDALLLKNIINVVMKQREYLMERRRTRAERFSTIKNKIQLDYKQPMPTAKDLKDLPSTELGTENNLLATASVNNDYTNDSDIKKVFIKFLLSMKD